MRTAVYEVAERPVVARCSQFSSRCCSTSKAVGARFAHGFSRHEPYGINNIKYQIKVPIHEDSQVASGSAVCRHNDSCPSREGGLEASGPARSGSGTLADLPSALLASLLACLLALALALACLERPAYERTCWQWLSRNSRAASSSLTTRTGWGGSSAPSTQLTTLASKRDERTMAMP